VQGLVVGPPASARLPRGGRAAPPAVASASAAPGGRSRGASAATAGAPAAWLRHRARGAGGRRAGALALARAHAALAPRGARRAAPPAGERPPPRAGHLGCALARSAAPAGASRGRGGPARGLAGLFSGRLPRLARLARGPLVQRLPVAVSSHMGRAGRGARAGGGVRAQPRPGWGVGGGWVGRERACMCPALHASRSAAPWGPEAGGRGARGRAEARREPAPAGPPPIRGRSTARATSARREGWRTRPAGLARWRRPAPRGPLCPLRAPPPPPPPPPLGARRHTVRSGAAGPLNPGGGGAPPSRAQAGRAACLACGGTEGVTAGGPGGRARMAGRWGQRCGGVRGGRPGARLATVRRRGPLRSCRHGSTWQSNAALGGGCAGRRAPGGAAGPSRAARWRPRWQQGRQGRARRPARRRRAATPERRHPRPGTRAVAGAGSAPAARYKLQEVLARPRLAHAIATCPRAPRDRSAPAGVLR
jgi:hypothetical protein